MKPATVVLFDFGGTLDADGIHWAPRFYAAYRTVGGSEPYDAFERIFKASDRTLEGFPRVRQLGFRGLIDEQARLLADTLPDGGALDAPRMATLFHAEALATVARNRPILQHLASLYTLGVVSNFTGNLEPCLAELGLRARFRAVVDSTVVGFSKPDARIFGVALEQLGATAGQAWMVGDNFETDVRPAAALGMRTCWLTPGDRTAPAGPAPTARIASLCDLEDALCTA